jgi:K+-sensing histidine kinase KdpD
LKQGKWEATERLLEGIQVSAKRAASLTQRLLAFSRRQTLDPRPTDINLLIDDLVDLINRSVGPAITVITQLEPELGLARIDPAQLESSLLNLAINSRDAMPEGRGAISITTQTIELDELMARRADLPAGEYIAISVTDSGSGISQENIKRILTRSSPLSYWAKAPDLGFSWCTVSCCSQAVRLMCTPRRAWARRFGFCYPNSRGNWNYSNWQKPDRERLAIKV